MTDLFENADQVAERSSFKAAIPQQRAKGFAGLSPRELIVLVAAIAMFIWGAWVTKNLVAGDDGRQDLVQLQLHGKIVVVHEAIIGGDVPDVTESVKAAVYAKVPRPQPAQAVRVQNEMQAFMASNGGGQGGVQR